MTDACVNLVYRMILNTMKGNNNKVWELYDEYQKEKRLHATVEEILDWKQKKNRAGAKRLRR